MINWICAIFAFSGFYLAALRLFSRCTDEVFSKSVFGGDKDTAHFFLFLSFLSWVAVSGLIALVLAWGYFANVSLSFRYWLNGAVGLILLTAGWPVLHNYKKVVTAFSQIRLERREKLILIFIAVLLLMYLYRVTLPWSDTDEASCYGYLSKLIAGGRTFQDIFREKFNVVNLGSHLTQSLDSILYGLVNDTYLVRLNRLANILFCGLGIFTLLRIIRVRRFWSLAATAAFLSTPELAYLALSLKVDSAVMMFELAAFLSIIMAFIIYWRDVKSRLLSKVAFYLSAAALLLAVFAFGNRFSGIFSVALCAGCAWFFLARQTKRPFTSFGAVMILSAFFISMASPGYWANLIIYSNPVYPLKPFWPFQNGNYTCVNTMELFRAGFNIVGLPPVILQIYLIIVLGIGLELLAKPLPFLNCLPMTAIRKGSMGWPYPFILSIFFWPFFIRSNKILNLIAGIFLVQFTCWSLGLHYSRLFVASSALMILAAVIMADQDIPAKDLIRQHVQKILKFWIILSLVLSLLLQFWWFGKRCWGAFLASAEKRYHAKIMFLKTRDYLERNELTLRETEMLNIFFLNKEPKPVVYVLTSSCYVIHILFDKRIHAKVFDPVSPYAGGGKYILINPEYLQENKALSKQSLLRYFPAHVLTTPDTKWEVYTVSSDKR